MLDPLPDVLLTIWQPTEDPRQMFAEGKAFRIRNLLASENRYIVQKLRIVVKICTIAAIT